MPLTDSVPNLLTHIPQVVVQLLLANNLLVPKTLSPLVDTKTSVLPSLLSNLLTTFNQYPSVLMLPLGLHTPVVSSLIALPPSIMPSYLPDIPALIG